jgi:uncharacterized membrane protein (Fun14 family)
VEQQDHQVVVMVEMVVFRLLVQLHQQVVVEVELEQIQELMEDLEVQVVEHLHQIVQQLNLAEQVILLQLVPLKVILVELLVCLL